MVVKYTCTRAGLANLDLRGLSRVDGPPSELQARREKYAFFEKQCSEVADGIFLGSDVVARNRETLRAAGITHVINCVGFLYPAYFKDELDYLVLYLQGELLVLLFDEYQHFLCYWQNSAICKLALYFWLFVAQTRQQKISHQCFMTYLTSSR